MVVPDKEGGKTWRRKADDEVQECRSVERQTSGIVRNGRNVSGMDVCLSRGLSKLEYMIVLSRQKEIGATRRQAGQDGRMVGRQDDRAVISDGMVWQSRVDG